MGDHFKEAVLLIKTAWGGKSLFKDFHPPSSGGEVGKYCNLMIAQVREGLSDLAKDFPEVKGRRPELAGFVWYQGWNDGVDPMNAIPEYEQNLVNLIYDIRREFNSPKLPLVIGELTGPWVKAEGEWDALRKTRQLRQTGPSSRAMFYLCLPIALSASPKTRPIRAMAIMSSAMPKPIS